MAGSFRRNDSDQPSTAADKLPVSTDGSDRQTPQVATEVGDDDSSEFGDPSRNNPADADSPLPEQIGGFSISKRLGYGNFGTVYLGHDGELDRPIALKVPRKERFANDNAIERFIEEARAAARLKHPGIVTVHHVGREEDGIYVVLEYVDGGDLDDSMCRSSFTALRAAELTADIADALSHAHQAGMVHRDLKPANILIDADGRPHIADFGLAIHENQEQRHRGEVAGSPAYMSPEQTRGESHRLDGRTDIWSLGVVLYQMLTQRLPFRADSVSELFDEIQNRDVRPPRQVRPDVPRELERICLKCLAKRMSDRYATAADLAEILREWLAGQAQLATTDRENSTAPVQRDSSVLESTDQTGEVKASSQVGGSSHSKVREVSAKSHIGNLGCGVTISLTVVTLLLVSFTLFWPRVNDYFNEGMADLGDVNDGDTSNADGDDVAHSDDSFSSTSNDDGVGRQLAVIDEQLAAVELRVETARIDDVERERLNSQLVTLSENRFMLKPPQGDTRAYSYWVELQKRMETVSSKLAPVPPATPQTYALLIGVNEFQRYPELKLQFAENDVTELAEVFKEQGIPNENILVLTGGREKSERPATRENIEREFRRIDRMLSSKDVLIVALSGRSVKFDEGDEIYFCPADADLKTKESLLGFDEIYDQLGQLKGQTIVMADVSHPFPRPSRSAAEFESGSQLAKKEAPPGVVTFFSSSAGENSFESPEGKHGLFFGAVIEGLRGKADADGDEAIGLHELVEYTQEKVHVSSRVLFNRPQTPTVNLSLAPAIQMSRVAPPPEALPDVPTPPVPSPADSHRLIITEVDSFDANNADDAIMRIARSIADYLKDRNLASVSIDTFSLPRSFDSSGDTGFAHALAEELQRHRISVEDRSAIAVRGRLAPVSDGLVFGLRADVYLVNRSGISLQELTSTFRVDETRIAVLAGLTVDLPTSASDEELRRSIARYFTKPQVQIDEDQIKSSDESFYAIEVLVARDGKLAPIRPKNEKGSAFVDLKRGDTYALRITNNSEHDAAVAIYIDGVNLLSYSKVESWRKTGQVIVPKQSSSVIRGWPIDERTVRQFQVGEPVDSVAEEQSRHTDSIGQITAVISASWGEDESPPADEQLVQRSDGAKGIGTGAAIQGNSFDSQRRSIGVPRAAITVRYVKPESDAALIPPPP